MHNIISYDHINVLVFRFPSHNNDELGTMKIRSCRKVDKILRYKNGKIHMRTKFGIDFTITQKYHSQHNTKNKQKLPKTTKNLHVLSEFQISWDFVLLV